MSEEITQEEKSPEEFYRSMVDLKMGKKKILKSFMKQYGIKVREAKTLYRSLQPKRKHRH